MIVIETQQQFIPGGIVKWGELFLIELVDVLVDESGSLVLVPHDSVQGGDITVPRNLRSISYSFHVVWSYSSTNPVFGTNTINTIHIPGAESS